MSNKKFNRERWIDDSIDVSDIKLKPHLQEIVDKYVKMIDNEDENVLCIWQDLDMFFKNAYADGEYSYEEWKRLEDKYRIW